MKSGIRIIRSLMAQWNQRQDARAATLIEDQACRDSLLVRKFLGLQEQVDSPSDTAPPADRLPPRS